LIRHFKNPKDAFLNLNKKAELTQRQARDSSACMKAPGEEIYRNLAAQASRSPKVIDFGAYQKRVCNFL